MRTRVAVSVAAFALVVGADLANAGGLPPVKAGLGNNVPGCVTSGRLMALIKARTPDLDRRFETIAADYRRHGEELGMRWDYAFYQMVVETGGLSFKNGNRTGSVKPQQNNFAGLGATGGDAGESFSDVSSGVRAHLEHLLIYAGERVEKPVAERTRKVQEWGVLKSWQKNMRTPITFDELAMHWANSKSYGTQIESVAQRFNEDHCSKPDPQPELTAAAMIKPEKVERPQKVAPNVSGAELARKAIEDGKAESDGVKSGLGAGAFAKAAPSVKILNAPKDETAEAFDEPVSTPATGAAPAKAAAAANTPPPTAGKTTEKSTMKLASAAGSAASAAKSAPPPAVKPAEVAPGKCRVWTASYGGNRAMIIKAPGQDGFTNYTVLDVNEGQETREADAYIAAYASGGAVAGEFTNQNLALDKAFELCPEG